MKQPDPGDLRSEFFQNLDPFRCQFRAERRNPGDIASGLREARYQRPRRAHGRHDHRNGRGRILGCVRGRSAPRHDEVDLEADQFGCEVGEALSATVRRPIFEDQVLTFDIAEIPQPSAQCSEISGITFGRYRLKNSDAIKPANLLRDGS